MVTAKVGAINSCNCDRLLLSSTEGVLEIGLPLCTGHSSG